jgi:hypothetical protein
MREVIGSDAGDTGFTMSSHGVLARTKGVVVRASERLRALPSSAVDIVLAVVVTVASVGPRS